MIESDQLDLTIISGLSGAGRSTAADVLEDVGYYVVDNLPPALIPRFAELAAAGEGALRHALVVDVRSGEFVDELSAALEELRGSGARVRILFVDADDATLVQRYEGTRRPHPLSEGGRVSEGIARERSRLEVLKGDADVVVDTSNLNVHELRDRLEELFGASVAGGLHLSVVSFGYKHGLPLDVDLVFDCRFLPNPHWVDELRPLSGLDPAVRDHVLEHPDTKKLLVQLDDLFELLLPAFEREGKSYLSVGIGCTGGRHRSVAVAEEVAQRLRDRDRAARLYHRDIDRD